MSNDKNNFKNNGQDNDWTKNLKEDLHKLDTDFPLSGGEEPLTPLEDTDDVFEKDSDDVFEEDDEADPE